MPSIRRLMAREITAETIHARYSYDPETGVFLRKTTAGGFRIGDRAGFLHNSGYRWIGANLEHCLAWLYVHSVWPTSPIDHIDGDKTNNRICNLREVTVSENCQNQKKATARSTTGFLGVQRNGKRFSAEIQIAGIGIWLGTYDTAKEAHKAYVAAKAIHHIKG